MSVTASAKLNPEEKMVGFMGFVWVVLWLFCLVGPYSSEAAASHQETESSRSQPGWISGSGDQLVFHLHGKVVDEQGAEVQDAKVEAALVELAGQQPLDVTHKNVRFSLDVSGKRDWWSIVVSAQSADGQCTGLQVIERNRLRLEAIGGIEVRILPAKRRLRVMVTDDGGPVGGASVKVAYGRYSPQTIVADDNGRAEFNLSDFHELSSITAWKSDERIGGFQFYQTPKRDPNLNEYSVFLNQSRPRKIRLLDENNQPVTNAKFRLQIATPAPDFNYLGSNEHTVFISDDKGEATAKWFPDWEDFHTYVEMLTDDWYPGNNGEFQVEGDTLIFQLKRANQGQRKRVQGRVELANGFPGGIHVQVRTYEGEIENRIEMLDTFTDADGNFVIDVLPGATYVYFVDDEEWISQPAHAILYDPETGESVPPIIHIIEGHPVKIVATQGADKKPLAIQTVRLVSRHEFSWIENGEQVGGRTGRTWRVTTDHNGEAETVASIGPLEATISSPEWRIFKEADVAAGSQTTIELHKEISEKRLVTIQL